MGIGIGERGSQGRNIIIVVLEAMVIVIVILIAIIKVKPIVILKRTLEANKNFFLNEEIPDLACLIQVTIIVEL